ncbi:MAG: GTPase Era [delta proteobacterium ML8_D]|jgi:GTPase|nr:MAG: GTPase Era [delta proteobacterium ML8_D]
MSFLSGFIAIIGPPNSGKSTLLNQLLGRKIAITSPKPQTTRNRIVGIYHGDDHQMVFIDTPGIHQPRSPLHKSMVSSAKASLKEVDIILLVAEPKDNAYDSEMKAVLELLNKLEKPALLALNKVDLIKKETLLPLIASYSKLHCFDAVIPISALYCDGLETLREELKKRLCPGPQYFPPDMITDKSEEFLIAEIIREKIYYETRRELPYSSAVVVEALDEDRERNLLKVRAVIYVEKQSQKGIIIGKSGEMIKRIGSKARMEVERLFSVKVYIDLFVKVEKKWSGDSRALRRLGY